MPMPPKRRKLRAQAIIFLPQLNSWCTGKDSNLRTSQGGADLQSAGFNHSPTCAEIRSRTRHSNQSNCALPLGSESARKNPSALTTHLENSLTVCRWKSCL